MYLATLCTLEQYRAIAFVSKATTWHLMNTLLHLLGSSLCLTIFCFLFCSVISLSKMFAACGLLGCPVVKQNKWMVSHLAFFCLPILTTSHLPQAYIILVVHFVYRYSSRWLGCFKYSHSFLEWGLNLHSILIASLLRKSSRKWNDTYCCIQLAHWCHKPGSVQR